MADCSRLAQNLNDIATEIAAREGINTLDDVVREMAKLIPDMNRETVVDAIVEATASKEQKATELSKKIRRIKQEAKTDKALQKKISDLENFLEEGVLPEEAKKKKIPSDTIARLRETKESLTKWLKNSDPVAEKRLQGKLDKLQSTLKEGDDVRVPSTEFREPVKKLQDEIDILRKQKADTKKIKAVEDDIDALQKNLDEGTLPEPKEKAIKDVLPELKLLRDIRTDLKKKLSETIEAQEQRRAKQEPKTIKNLRERIAELERFIETGEVPPPATKRGIGPTPAVQELRETRDKLKKELAASEPVQIQRLKDQIQDLTERIDSGDIFPKSREPKPPQSKELERLEFERDELRRNIRRKIQALKPKSIWEHIAEPFNTARGIMTAFDFSAVFRQGGFIAFGRPLLAAKSIGPMLRAFVSKQEQAKIEKEILNRPNAPLYRKAKLFIAPTDGTHRLSEREEIMQAKLLDKIPGVAASNRAYTTFLNKLRADTFDTMVAGLSRDGDVTLEEAKAIANYVNNATGRGGLGAFEQSALGLNIAFFAPRYVASRFQLIAGQPFFGGNARTRTAIGFEYARYLIGLGTVYALAALTLDDEEFETDIRSSDFGKIKVGNTRLDPLSGISQVSVLLGRLILGESKSSVTGEITPIRGEDVAFGRRSTSGVIGTFLRGKLSPLFGSALNILEGRNLIGEEVTLKSETVNLLTPIALGEVLETMEEQGIPRGTALSLLAIFGMGIQTYGLTTDNRRNFGRKFKKRKLKKRRTK